MGLRYDVVIVGAGSAGCVLAESLSQDPSRQVLLLEAGPDAAPAATSGDSFFTALAEPGRTFAGLRAVRTRDAAPSPYLLGRGVGGSSAVNAMLGTWGTAADYDHWERDLGCPGWGWREVAPVFAALRIPLAQPDPAEWGDVDRALVQAATQLGHPASTGPAPGTLGVGAAWLTRARGRRVSAADAYLAPARARSNLTVRTDAPVARVVLDGRTAGGVQLVDGELIEAVEVVMAAGAIHTPALLLRSGVARSGIGTGLKDHASATLVLRLAEPADTDRLAAATLLRWSSAGGAGDLQLLPLNQVGEAGYGALVAGVMSVRSSGSVRLVDDQPVVQFAMLSDDRDMVRLREAARHTIALAATEPFRRITDAVLIDEIGTSVDAIDDEVLFDEWLRGRTGDYVHASSSCRMGPIDDPGAVVDTEGRVHEHTGLRVGDASVFPDLPAANLHLPTVMVAERIARAMTGAGLSARGAPPSSR